MTGTGLTPAWRGTSASLRGSAHGAHGVNQDAVRMEEVATGDGGTAWVAAVSDGHGGARYVRSETGAQLAVAVSVATLTELLQTGHGVDATLLPAATARVVARWREEVRAHLVAHPFTDEEVARAGDVVRRDPAVAYGATLIVAVAGDHGVLLAQIGDGDALVRTHGFAVRPVPGDGRLVANETTSLCLDSAVEDFRFAALPAGAEVDLVVLASDGYGNSFAAHDWWHGLVGDLAWYVDVHGFDAFAAHLPQWLAESALVGGDDVTAAVLTRPLPAPGPGAPPVPGGEPPPVLAPTPVDPARPRPRRCALLVTLAVLVLVALVVVAVLAGVGLPGGGDGDPVDPTPSTPGATVPSGPSGASSPRDGSTPRDRPPARPDRGEGDLPSRPPGGGTKDGGQPKP